MNPRDAYARILAVDVPVMRTSEVASALHLTTKAASILLTRLDQVGLVRKLRKGIWIVTPRAQQIDRYTVIENLTSPFPSYVSLQSALYQHGMIEQVPSIIYAVTLGETERVRTTLGMYSFHHITPELFDGFESRASGIKLATPEKALFDVAYFSGSRTRIFSHLPELELPRRFSKVALREWVGRIETSRRRSMVKSRLEQLLDSATSTT